MENSVASIENGELEERTDVTIDGQNACTADNYKVHYWIYTIDHDGAFLRMISWAINSKAE